MKVRWTFENGSAKVELQPESPREKTIINLFMFEQGTSTGKISTDANSNLTIESVNKSDKKPTPEA